MLLKKRAEALLILKAKGNAKILRKFIAEEEADKSMKLWDRF